MAFGDVPPTATGVGTVGVTRTALHTAPYLCAWIHIYNPDDAKILYISGQKLLSGLAPTGDATDGIPIAPGGLYQFPSLSSSNAYDLAALFLRGSAAAAPYILMVGKA